MTIEEFINHSILSYEQMNEEVDLNKICDSVEEQFSSKCTHEYIGGFDSTGYSIDCHAIAFVNEDNAVTIVPYTHECC